MKGPLDLVFEILRHNRWITRHATFEPMREFDLLHRNDQPRDQARISVDEDPIFDASLAGASQPFERRAPGFGANLTARPGRFGTPGEPTMKSKLQKVGLLEEVQELSIERLCNSRSPSS